MFEFLAPLSGRVMELVDVPDNIFSSKVVGEGVAIDSTDNIVVAPADGHLAVILQGNHAFCMKLDNGVLVIVHIGIDTVKLKGEGFERIIEAGTRVKVGDPIVRIDREKVIGKGYSLITPVLITNMDLIEGMDYKAGSEVIAGKDVILSYSIN